jgi:hypothetical protein
MEKYRASVRTILSRIESHPDEFREHFGKWEDIQNAVADRIGGERNRLRGLTDEEVEAIFNKLKEHIWGPQFDTHVMEKVLDPQREERSLDAYNISLGKSGLKVNPYGWNDPRLLQAIKPEEIYAVPDPMARQKAELQKIYEEQRRQQAEQKESVMQKLINKLKP